MTESQHSEYSAADHIAVDYIVVGGGSAGCVVAARLAEAKQGRVLLLESGQSARDNPETMTADGFKQAFSNDNTMYDRMSTPQQYAGNRQVYLGSGRGMGGSGSVNGMVYTRGDRRDFTNWPDNWQWQDVVPAFEALEQRLGVQPRSATQFTDTCIKAAIKSGFKQKDGLNDGCLCGYIGYNDMNYRGDQRRSSYTALIHDREAELEWLSIKTEARVHRIIFDEQQRATAVEYVTQGKKQRATVNKELILCAGALETPKLLMLSGVGPRDELEKFQIPLVLDSPRIGKNLQDHPSVCVFFKGDAPVDFHYPQLYGFHRVNMQLDLSNNQADTCFVLMSVGSVLNGTLKRMIPVMALPGRLYHIRWLKNALRKMVERVLAVPAVARFTEKMYGIVVILGKPVSRGEVRLNSTDPEQQAAIDMAFYQDPTDMDTMIAGIELAHRIAQQAELKSWGNQLLSKAAKSKNRAKLEKWIGKGTVTVFHYSGTCSMGDGEGAPVDSELRVKGLRNVRVADASVIPDIPVSALNAPSMMIGYRAADFIIHGR